MEQSQPVRDMTPEELAAAQAQVDAAWPALQAEIEQMLQEQRYLEEQIDAINAVLFLDHADLDQKQADECTRRIAIKATRNAASASYVLERRDR